MTPPAPILVINPNSNPAVTAGIDRAVAPFRLADGPRIECVTLEQGPFGIESAHDGAVVAPMLAALVTERRDAGAIVIACFSDPGLAACREVAQAPVIGIGEAGMTTAMARAGQVGVIALSEGSIRRHWARWRALGIASRVAGEVAVEASVADSSDPAVFPRLEAAGAALAAEGAEALVLGCAGMADRRGALEQALGLPVVDPVQAASALALSAILARA
ncbi:MAG: aspartate/glutamate racemase family protein [Pseudomonadota bacterium]